MKNAIYPRLKLIHQREKSLHAGHPWIFSGAFEALPALSPGVLVHIESRERVIATGYYHPKNDIAVRILSFHHVDIDLEFLIERFKALKFHKEALLPENTNAYRVAFGESDGLPGLIVDQFKDVLVCQYHTAGMENLSPLIVSALKTVYSPSAIVERRDISNRVKEGLQEEEPRLVWGSLPEELVFEEYGFQFVSTPLSGQKTGFFLDHREARKSLSKYCINKNMLNCFCYTAGFSIYAAKQGAKVCNVDSSKIALEIAQRNYTLNNIDAGEQHFLCEDVFTWLKTVKKGDFDVILLDPPSMAKHKGQLRNALRGYINLNTTALQKLPDYGILATASCTSHVDAATFLWILHESAVHAGCHLRVLESREQAFDHGFNPAFPEGRYLKFWVVQKLPRP